MLHVDLDEFSWFQQRLQVFVFHPLHAILFHHSFRFQYLSDGAFVDLDAVFLQFPVELERTDLLRLPQSDDVLLESDRSFLRRCLRPCRLWFERRCSAGPVRREPPLNAPPSMRTHLHHFVDIRSTFCHGYYPPLPLLPNCFCHMNCHFPTLTGSAICVCTLPPRIDI